MGENRRVLSRLFEEVKPASTPDEMRAEIFRLSYNDNLVRSVMQMADYNGLNAEDRYTILAYNALKQRADLLERELQLIHSEVRTPFIFTGPE
jgi:hypothetical protein